MCAGPVAPIFRRPSPPPAPAPVAATVSAPSASAPQRDTSGDGYSAQSRRRARVQAGGRRSTLMSTPAGVLGEPNIGRATLLGG